MIAGYREETGFGYCRLLELHEDHILVRAGASGQKASEIRIRLDSLRPEPNRVYMKDPRVFKPTLFCAASLFLFGLYYGFTERQLETGMLSAMSMAALAVVLLFRFGPQIEYAQFVHESGPPGVDVARSGPQKKDFDMFVARIIDQIRKRKRTGDDNA